MYPIGYITLMYSIYTTEVFDDWFTKLKDQQAKRRIQVRIDRVEDGNFGDTEPVGEGVSELRFFFGPGYRIYYCKQGQRVVILLAGGDKSTQSKDIKLALQLAQDLEEEL
jgi:putative addiction module killer protein